MGYTINGEAQDIPQAKEVDGITFIPLAKVVETLGGYVTWNNAAKVASIELGDKKADLEEGSSSVNVGGEVSFLPAAPFNESGIIWAPSAFFADILGCSVDIEGHNVAVASQ